MSDTRTTDPTDFRQATIDAPSGTISNTSSFSPSGLPKAIKMPLGLFAFTLSDLTPGATVQMSMTADADLKQLVYYKKSLVTGKWTNITDGVTVTADGKAIVKFSLTDGGEYDADRTVNGVIVDPGGVAENSLNPITLENDTAVGSVTLQDTTQVTGTLAYTITGGADKALFSVNAGSGALSFIAAPDYETPLDTGDTAGNNTYEVQVTITGSTRGSEVQGLIVTVLDVPESGATSGVTATDKVNSAPAISGLPGTALDMQVGTASPLPDFTVTDSDGNALTVTLQATNGTINGLIDADSIAVGIQLKGTAAAINAAITAATFTAAAAGAASISISATDGIVSTPTTATIDVTAKAEAVAMLPDINNLPVTTTEVAVGGATPLADVAIADTGITQLTVTLTETNGTISGVADADPTTPGIQLVGTAAQINAVLADASFTTTSAGDAAVIISVSNGTTAAPLTAVINMTGVAFADTDNVSNLDENLVPVLTPKAPDSIPVAGDGNGDGVADSQQTSVTSIPFRNTDSISLHPDAPQAYVTLVADSTAGIPGSTTDSVTSTRLGNVQQLDAPAHLPAELAMPLGIISFTATLAQPSTVAAPVTETFSLFVDSSIAINGYWKQDAAGVWNNIATKIETVGGKTRIDFAITDGGQFDSDHTVNGVIVDPGALGTMPLSIVGAISVVSGNNFWF